MKSVILLLSVFCAAIAGFFWYVTRPEAFLSSSSPNGHYHLVLERFRVPPYIQGVAVIARITTLKSKEETRSKIADVDDWDDATTSFMMVTWEDRSALIKPGRWDEEAVVPLPE